MKKNLKRIFLLAFYFLASTISYAQTAIESGMCSENVTWTFYDTGELVISGIGAIPNYSIYTSSEQPPWYNKATEISSLTIAEGITKIGGYAFSDCTSLTSIVLPSSVTRIEESAFYRCSNLSNVVFSDNIVFIGPCAFSQCINITSLSIPNGVIFIGSYAFNQCTNLTSISIPKSVEYIGSGAFDGCINLPVIDNIRYADTYVISAVDRSLTTYTIREGTRFIGDYAFSNCSSLSNIRIPESVICIGSNVFDGCSNLPVIDNIRYADTYAIKAVNNALSTYTLKEGTRFIGAQAFMNNRNLTNIKNTQSVVSVGGAAFSGCYNLSSVGELGACVNIGSEAFFSCNSLTHINLSTCICIDRFAFECCESLADINLSACKVIERYAFRYCYCLTEVYIPANVVFIGNNPFSYCNTLESIVVSKDNPTYDSREGCNAIIDTKSNAIITGCINTVFKDISTISIGAFNGSNLTNMIIPEGVKYIESYVFQYCSSLTFVSIPESVTRIGSNAFDCCSSLQEMFVKKSTPPSVGPYAFSSVPTNRCQLKVPHGSATLFASADGWSEFTNIVEEPIPCATPTISYDDGKIKLQCETGGATFYCSIVAADNAAELFEVTSNEVSLSKKFVVTAYAVAEGYTQSESATLTITLSDGDVNGDGEINVTDVTKLVDIILHSGGN